MSYSRSPRAVRSMTMGTRGMAGTLLAAPRAAPAWLARQRQADDDGLPGHVDAEAPGAVHRVGGVAGGAVERVGLRAVDRLAEGDVDALGRDVLVAPGEAVPHADVAPQDEDLVAGVLLEEQLMQLGRTGHRVAQRYGGGLAVGLDELQQRAQGHEGGLLAQIGAQQPEVLLGVAQAGLGL